MDAGRPASGSLTLGIRANLAQFSLLVAVNAFVGTMVGLERSVLPLLAEREFGITSASVALSFLIAFGIVKAFANLAAGALSDRIGRKPLLVAGWLAGLPVAPMIILAPSWAWVVAANVLLGVNQGLAWSATVVMKIDLAGPKRRGLAMGLNEVAGYGAVSLAAAATGYLAATYGPRPAPYIPGIAVAVLGLVVSVVFVRETHAHALGEAGEHERRNLREIFVRTSFRDRTLQAICQAGLVNNLNDGMAWGLLPVFLASRGLSVGRIAAVAAAYPASWTLSQLATGPLSDALGRKPLIVWGLFTQAAGIVWVLVAGGYAAWFGAAIVMGVGTALVYPALLAAVGDAAHPSWRASAVGVYRLWRDLGYAAGAIVSGVAADLFGLPAAIGVVAVLTAASGVFVQIRMAAHSPTISSAARTS